MKTKNIVFLSALLLILNACDAQTENLSKAKLLFSSGFEGDLNIGELVDGYRPITGTDSVTGFKWPINIRGASEQTGLHYINDMAYLSLNSEIRTVEGHDNNKPTKALYSEVTCDPDYKKPCTNFDTQNPYEILALKDGKSDLYVSYWIKLDSTSFEKLDGWRTFFEWKTKDYDKGTGFRLISYIYSDEYKKGELFWHWQGDHNPNIAADWEFDNKDIPVPLDKWFFTEYYWSWNEGNGGRALWKINGKVVKDYLGPTAEEPNLPPALPSKGVEFIMLTQIYGDSNPKHQWIDDIEIWDGIPQRD